jgi:hypothetical protein
MTFDGGQGTGVIFPCFSASTSQALVIPTKVGIQYFWLLRRFWIPAVTGLKYGFPEYGL